MVCKYESCITNIGEKALHLLECNHCLILFDEKAPEELAEISVLHKNLSYESEIKAGDTMFLDDVNFKIESVGSEVNRTLKSLGHCTVVFKKGKKEGKLLPGMLLVSGGKTRSLKNLRTIQIFGDIEE